MSTPFAPELRPGMRLQSQTGPVELIVIRPGPGGILACGGLPMVGPGDVLASAPHAAEAAVDAVQLGKRYTDATGTLEVLCTQGGAGPLTLDGAILTIKAAAALPASD
ncbi:hypothetical protein ACFQ34_30030 [Pseudonocardia benzenivorans]|uniref:Uncharacterized protein n=1 Tax=Pseudonocardia benzenivorans TaxID=228005 RepID=A0ABW3VTU2_9PSEU